MKSGEFIRDASNRLMYAIFDLDADSYPDLCRKVVAEFSLIASSGLVFGFSEIFRDYTDGTVTIGLEWDNWSGFIVVAKQPDAEPLVRRIAMFLSES